MVYDVIWDEWGVGVYRVGYGCMLGYVLRVGIVGYLSIICGGGYVCGYVCGMCVWCKGIWSILGSILWI